MKEHRCRVAVVALLSLVWIVVLNASLVLAGQVTLTYWEIAVDDRMAAAREIIAEFERLNPDIKVDLQPLSNTGRVDRLVTAVVGGQGPDVVSWWGAEFKRLALEGMWLDLAPYVKNSLSQDDLNDFFPNQLAYFRLGDMLYALPQYAGTVVTLVNKTLFDQNGVHLPSGNWNLNDFVNIGKKLTYDTSGDGTPDKYGFVFLRMQDRLGMSIKRAGGSLLENDDMYKFGLDTPESIAALEWLQGLIHREAISPSGTQAQWRIQAGNVGMEENGPWQVSQARLYDVPFELAVVESPQGPLGKVSYLGSDGYAVVSTTKHPDAAYRFVEFLAGRYAMTVRARVAGLQPSRRSVAQVWLNAFRTQFPTLSNVNWIAFFNAAEYAEPEPYFHNYTEVWALLMPALNEIWNGAPVRTTIEKVAGPIQAILDRR
jgi:multiple sugar transport system substrate-binding protein